MGKEKKEAKKTEIVFHEPQKGLTEKKCSILGKVFPINCFWKDKYMKDGYTSYTKEGYKKRWILKDPTFAGKKYRKMD